MKNIVLTTLILLLTMKFNFNRNFSAGINALPVDTVVYKNAGEPHINKPAHKDTLLKAKRSHKPTHTSHKAKSIKKSSRKKTTVQLMNKAGSVNQTNLKLHKKVSAEGMFVEKKTVNFGFDKNTLNNNKTFNEILHIADKLIFDSTLKISIAGFTDNVGSIAYNNMLSQKRAQMVKDYLIDLGVSEAQIHLSFNGMSDPVSDNNTPDGRAENRRVEFVLFTAG